MNTFAIATLGCKVNIYESGSYSEGLKKAGLQEVDFKEKADVYIINTCAVTNTAAAKSRQKINQAKRQNPDALICVVGCYVQIASEKMRQDEEIDILIGASGKKDLVSNVLESMREKEKRIKIEDVREYAEFEDLPCTTFEHKTRAFLKVQDGCNQFCAYCIIPYARGKERSMDEDIAIETAKKLVEHGHKEIVLSGVHTGRFGRDKNTSLAHLIRRMCDEIEGLERIRISSIEIVEITDELIDLMANNPKIANHFHIPVQSGSNETLRRMHRPYTTEQFLNRVNEIRKKIPGISISTDLIVGFPMESDEEFKETLDFLNKIQFSFIHVFPFSSKEGTIAHTMKGQVDEKIKKNRASLVGKLSKQGYHEYMNTFVNQELEVLIETIDENGISHGHSSEYIPTAICQKLNPNQLVKVIGSKLVQDEFYAKVKE